MWGDRPATMLAAKRSAGVTPEVNLGECISCTPLPSVNKAVHSGFETQRRHYQKSKTGVSVAQKWTCVHQKFQKIYIAQQIKSNEAKGIHMLLIHFRIIVHVEFFKRIATRAVLIVSVRKAVEMSLKVTNLSVSMTISAFPVESVQQGQCAANVVPVYMEHHKQSGYPLILVHCINHFAAHVAFQQNQECVLKMASP